MAGKCELVNVTNQAAYILRENTGTSGIVESARAAVSTLAEHDIPHLIVGGLAVQEHGYPRVTIDVDIVVPDVLEAVEFLTASLTGPFYRVPDVDDRVEDRRNGVQIDLLPAGKVLKRGCKVPFPQLGKVSDQLQFVKLEELIALKLDSWSGSPARRLKDKADVNELILRRKLPRDLAVNPVVRALYTETWDVPASGEIKFLGSSTIAVELVFTSALPMNLLVGRVTPCAPGFGIQANGAHGVTRPTPASRFRGAFPGSAGVPPACSSFRLRTGRRDAGAPRRFMVRADVH